MAIFKGEFIAALNLEIQAAEESIAKIKSIIESENFLSTGDFIGAGKLKLNLLVDESNGLLEEISGIIGTLSPEG